MPLGNKKYHKNFAVWEFYIIFATRIPNIRGIKYKMDKYILNPIDLGKLLKEELKQRRTSQKVFAEAIGLRPSHLSEIINGKRQIPTNLLPQVALFLGLSIDQLLESQSDIALTRKKGRILSTEDAEASDLLKKYDEIVSVKSLLKPLQLDSCSEKQRLDEMVKQYNLPSPKKLSEDFNKLSQRCFRRSAKNGRDNRMIYTWTLKAQKVAKVYSVEVPYDHTKTEELAERLCTIFHQNRNTMQRLKEILFDYGIGFGIVEKEEHASIDGYSFFYKEHPYIIITNRYKRIDNLAFTIMHELGHIALGHTNEEESMINIDERFLEQDTDEIRTEKEMEADNYATNKLIPENIWCLTPKVPLNPYAIQSTFTKWAATRQLNEWIVLGRVSYETGMFRFKSTPNRNIN